MSKFKKIFNWVLNILIIILLIVVIYMFIDRIFGNSPTDFQIISGTFSLLGVFIIKLFTLIYSINREIGEVERDMKHSFFRVKEDTKRIENKIDDLLKIK